VKIIIGIRKKSKFSGENDVSGKILLQETGKSAPNTGKGNSVHPKENLP